MSERGVAPGDDTAGPDEDSAGFGQETERVLASLRDQFDRSFRTAPAQHRADETDYVLVSAGGQGYALAAGDLAGVEDGCRVIAVPSAEPALAGIAGVRGAVVPVFFLAALLGHGQGQAEEIPDRLSFALVWVTEGRAGQPRERTSGRFGQEAQQVGLAFDQLDRFVRVARSALYAAALPGGSRSLADGDRLYALLDVKGLVGRLTGAQGGNG